MFQYQCLCKSNVVGRTCDRCMHGFYNFSGSNPSGCLSCGCSPRGSVSGTRNCHVQTGRCVCKNHVMGKKCQNCQDGYYGMRSQDIFGCKGEMLFYLQGNVSTLLQKKLKNLVSFIVHHRLLNVMFVLRMSCVISGRSPVVGCRFNTRLDTKILVSILTAYQ